MGWIELRSFLGHVEGPDQRDALPAATIGSDKHRGRITRIAKVFKADSDELDSRGHLVRLLRAFDPIWAVLYPRERTRVVQLLIDRIDYDGQRGKLKIVYSEAGAKLLMAEIKGEGRCRVTSSRAKGPRASMDGEAAKQSAGWLNCVKTASTPTCHLRRGL